jgi:hypothetical protein
MNFEAYAYKKLRSKNAREKNKSQQNQGLKSISNIDKNH